MRVVLGAALSAALLFSATASAGGFAATPDPRAAPVSYTDLNLDRAEDTERLLARLHEASERVCELRELSQLGPAARRAMRACVDETLAHAVAQLDQPQLTHLHEQLRR